MRPFQAALAVAEGQSRAERLRDVAQLALVLMGVGPTGGGIARALQNVPPGSRAHKVLKAAVSGSTMTDTEALAAQEMTQALLAAASRSSFFDALLADALPGAIATQVGLISSLPAGSAATEGKAHPVGRFLATRASMEPHTVRALIGLSKDLLRRSSLSDIAEAIVQRTMPAAIIAAQDAVALPLITAGAPTHTAAGVDASGIRSDLRHSLEALPLDAGSRLHLALPPAVAKRLTMLGTSTGAAAFPEMGVQGGRIADITVGVSDGLTADAVLADASAFVMYGSAVELRESESAAIEMDSTPSGAANDGASPPAPAETTLVSLFQADAVAVRAERRIALAPIRTGAVVIQGVSSLWGLEGSPPA